MDLSTQILLAGQSQGVYVEILFLGSKWAREFSKKQLVLTSIPKAIGNEREDLCKSLHATAENYPDLSLGNGEMGALHAMSLGNHMQTCREYWFNAFISKNSYCPLH